MKWGCGHALLVKNDSSSGTYLSPQKSPKAAIAVLGERTEFGLALQPLQGRWVGKLTRYLLRACGWPCEARWRVNFRRDLVRWVMWSEKSGRLV